VRYRSPGRVNLIGGHVDYHDGIVVSVAIDRAITAEVRPRRDRVISLSSDAFFGDDVTIDVDRRVPVDQIEPRWGRMVGGVVAALAEAGLDTHGFDAALHSTIPAGAGLSSSAALSVLIVTIIADLTGIALDPNEVARFAQRAELLATQMACGIQDPMTIVCGGTIELDCRTLTAVQLVLPDDVDVVVFNSGVARALSESPWASRRAETLDDAERLGLAVLRDATPESVSGSPRARHVVTEIARVEAFTRALTDGDMESAGALMVASHESSRDDFESSIPELDLLVEAATSAGAYGARLTGGGFGGCVVALVPRTAAESVTGATVRAYVDQFDRQPGVMVVHPAPGTGLTSPEG